MSENRDNRARHVSVRVTQAERETLQRRAGGRALSDYIRGKVLGRNSRAPLELVERQTLRRLSEVGDLVSNYAEHVATSDTLRRREVVTFLGGVEDDLQALRLSILRGGDGGDNGDC
ncbi:hypothetical protein [Sulfitobacter sp. R18_1]|uniref:plasmid mobilization protein n=1 Tax=Sulfitobacter sp. R18_1 TaxID=2821104 RepID=UPI001ADB12E7|nr:hypothetical protein [Sulfitobacter sp. R18_1]MBO9432168.1 hypothetical protein [Sulfitobacter sp. R18_1]